MLAPSGSLTGSTSGPVSAGYVVVDEAQPRRTVSGVRSNRRALEDVPDSFGTVTYQQSVSAPLRGAVLPRAPR